MRSQEHFRNQGYAQFEGLTPEPLVMTALKAIEHDLDTNYDPESQTQSFVLPKVKGHSGDHEPSSEVSGS